MDKSDSVEKFDVNKLEYKKPFSVKETVDLLDFSRFSSLEKFIKCLKNQSEKSDALTMEEVLDAEKYLIRSEQEKFFKEEIESTHLSTITTKS